MSERAKEFTNKIFGLFGGLYKGAIQGLARQAPEEIRRAFVALINEARLRSGLPPERSMKLVVALRDVLSECIDQEEKHKRSACPHLCWSSKAPHWPAECKDCGLTLKGFRAACQHKNYRNDYCPDCRFESNAP